jgi:hypothetical protein
MAQLTPRIVLPEDSHSLVRVAIVEQIRNSCSPGGTRSVAHSHVRIGLDVSNVIGTATMLDDQPKRIAVWAIADWCVSRSTSVSTDRFQEGIARWARIRVATRD